jgi:predicted nuclease of predicted toxin-antitoxin system
VPQERRVNDLAFMRGPSPKVIWLRIGNTSTSTVEILLVEAVNTIISFAANEEDAVLVLASKSDASDNNARQSPHQRR